MRKIPYPEVSEAPRVLISVVAVALIVTAHKVGKVFMLQLEQVGAWFALLNVHRHGQEAKT